VIGENTANHFLWRGSTIVPAVIGCVTLEIDPFLAELAFATAGFARTLAKKY
jgi:hypothetical protein